MCGKQLNKAIGKIILTVNSNYAIVFSSKLADMLGISSRNIIIGAMPYYPGFTLTLMKFTVGTYTSTTSISLAPHKTLNTMLEQINTETNNYNGAPSTILDVIGVLVLIPVLSEK